MEMRGQDSSSLYHNHKYQESEFYAIYSKKKKKIELQNYLK